MKTAYQEQLKVYTDGLTYNKGVGAAVDIPAMFKLDPSQSIFEAEVVTISKAANYLMSISSDNAKILICSESRVQLKQYNQ